MPHGTVLLLRGSDDGALDHLLSSFEALHLRIAGAPIVLWTDLLPRGATIEIVQRLARAGFDPPLLDQEPTSGELRHLLTNTARCSQSFVPWVMARGAARDHQFEKALRAIVTCAREHRDLSHFAQSDTGLKQFERAFARGGVKSPARWFRVVRLRGERNPQNLETIDYAHGCINN